MTVGEEVAGNEKIIPEGSGKDTPDACFWAFKKECVVIDNIADVNGVTTLVGGEMKVVA